MSKRFWKTILVLSLLGHLGAFYVFPKYQGYAENRDSFTVRYDSLLQDFGGREFYDSDNEQLVAAGPEKPRIVLIGSEFALNWDLDQRLPGYQVINRGVDKQRVAGMLDRFRPDVIDLEPETVLIGVSAYNFRPWSSIAEILDYVACMTELAQINGIRPVLVNTTPPTEVCHLEEYSKWIVKDSLAEFNDRLEEYARTEEILCLDFYSLVTGELGFLKADYAASQTDLNDSGYALVTAMLEKQLRQNEKPKVNR